MGLFGKKEKPANDFAAMVADYQKRVNGVIGDFNNLQAKAFKNLEAVNKKYQATMGRLPGTSYTPVGMSEEYKKQK